MAEQRTMDHARDGYVTEIPYSSNHFPEMAPAHLNLALLQLGLAAPALTADFTYLELGFGQGLGLNLLAATHAQGRFFGNDFMPAHVRAAQALADHGGLDNLRLFEDSFTQLLARDLPPMDYIVLHGVYSWINDENRATVVALLDKFLKPAGVVYISYNCLPGWSLKMSMQRLMSEFVQRRIEGSVLKRYHAARDFLSSLEEADAAFFSSNPPAHGMLRDIREASDAYLLHEFAPQGWSPFYHTDIARALAPADLAYAGSARLFNNFPRYSLPPAMRGLIEKEQDNGMRELLRDFATQTQLRRDIFVRGGRNLSQAEIDEQYRSLEVSLWRPPASCALRCRIPVGEIELEEELVAPLLQSLTTGPQSVAALLQLPVFKALGAARCIETMNVLLCLGYIGVASSVPEEQRSRVHGINHALLTRLQAGERISGLASASLGAAIAISYHDLLFLAGQNAGCIEVAQLAAFACDILARNESEEVTDGADMTEQLTHEARNFLRYGDQFYRSLNMF